RQPVARGYRRTRATRRRDARELREPCSRRGRSSPQFLARAGVAVRSNHLLIYHLVLADHAIDTEFCHSAAMDLGPVEREDTTETGHHLIEILEHDTCDAVIDDLADRAAVQRRDRRSARDRFSKHEAERFRRLDGVEECARSAVQTNLCTEI